MPRKKITVYLEDSVFDLLNLETAKHNRSLSNLCENLIIKGLSVSPFLLTHLDLSALLTISPDELADLVSSPDKWPVGYQWSFIFSKWIQLS